MSATYFWLGSRQTYTLRSDTLALNLARWIIELGFTLPSPLIFTPTGFGSHLYTAQRSDRAVGSLCRFGLTRSTCDHPPLRGCLTSSLHYYLTTLGGVCQEVF